MVVVELSIFFSWWDRAGGVWWRCTSAHRTYFGCRHLPDRGLRFCSAARAVIVWRTCDAVQTPKRRQHRSVFALPGERVCVRCEQEASDEKTFLALDCRVAVDLQNHARANWTLSILQTSALIGVLQVKLTGLTQLETSPIWLHCSLAALDLGFFTKSFKSALQSELAGYCKLCR